MDPTRFHADTLTEQVGFIRRLAHGLLVDREQVPDVVQDTLRIALEQRPDTQRSLHAWLRRVVQNLSRSRNREALRRLARERQVARPEAESEDATAQRLEDVQRVTAVLQRLPREQREVLLDRFFDELPPREIARKRGLPVNTVRTRTRRALERMREELDREYGAESWTRALLPWLLVPGSVVPPVADAPVATGLETSTTAAVPATGTALLGGLVMSSAVKWTVAAVVLGAALWSGQRWVSGGEPARSSPDAATPSGTNEMSALDTGTAAPVATVAANRDLQSSPVNTAPGEPARTGARVSGVVRSRSSGQVLEGTQMLVWYRSRSEPGDEFGAKKYWSGHTDLAGQYAATLPADAFELTKVDASREVILATRTRDARTTVELVIPLSPDTDTSVNVDLEDEGFRVSGRVVSDVTGQPLAGATVSVPTVMNLSSFRTEADGLFEIVDLLPADATAAHLDLEALHPDTLPSLTRIALTATFADREDLELRLEHGHTLEGIVRDAEGKPCGDCVVQAELPVEIEGDGAHATRPMHLDHPVNRNAIARTNAHGRFRLGPLPLGAAVELWAERDGGSRSDRVTATVTAEAREWVLTLPEAVCTRVVPRSAEGAIADYDRLEMVAKTEDGSFRKLPFEEGAGLLFAPAGTQAQVLCMVGGKPGPDELPPVFTGQVEFGITGEGQQVELWLSRSPVPEAPASYFYFDAARYAAWGAYYDIRIEDAVTGVEPPLGLLTSSGDAIATVGMGSSNSRMRLFVAMGSHAVLFQCKGYWPVEVQMTPGGIGEHYRLVIPMRPVTTVQ